MTANGGDLSVSAERLRFCASGFPQWGRVTAPRGARAGSGREGKAGTEANTAVPGPAPSAQRLLSWVLSLLDVAGELRNLERG